MPAKHASKSEKNMLVLYKINYIWIQMQIFKDENMKIHLLVVKINWNFASFLFLGKYYYKLIIIDLLHTNFLFYYYKYSVATNRF